MRFSITILSLILFLTACKKDRVSDPAAQLLTTVMVGNKIHESFEYNEQGQLIKESSFGMCTATPQDESVYTYQNNRIDNIKSVTRSIYSSLSSMCDPATGYQFQQSLTYDSRGRISSLTTTNSVVEYIYNQEGFVQKKVITDGANSLTYQYIYDSRGNVITEIDPQGNIQEFEYDNKINPYYHSKIRVGTLTPFTMSPNNIIKGNGASGSFVRKFKYDSRGLPAEVLEDNGQTYLYMYK